jgi:hypothetical protein
MCVVLGYAAQTFTTGSFAYFGVQYLKNRLGMDVDVAGISNTLSIYHSCPTSP